MSTIRSAANDYHSAEITCVLVEDRNTRRKTNLLTLIEMVPAEQEPSPIIGSPENHYTERLSVGKDHTLYIARIVGMEIQAALALYENVENGLNLKYDTLDALVELASPVTQEPPDYNNLLIDTESRRTFGKILPWRNTAFRVWSKLNTNKEWLSVYNKKFFQKLTTLTQKHLGFNLSEIPEHIGSIYLFGCNPIFRNMHTTLTDTNRELLLSFSEREGKSIVGCTIVLEEKRSKNIGFTIRQQITSNREKVRLPHFPASLNTKLYDANSLLLENSTGVWANIHFNMGIVGTQLNLTLQTDSGLKVYSVPKISKVDTVKVGSFDAGATHFLENAEKLRHYQVLEQSRDFIFFPQHKDSPLKAQEIVRELLNNADNRCMILDPYFGESDLVYAFRVENISIPVQIISSAAFLGTKPKLPGGVRGKRRAESLLENLTDYTRQYPQQKIECKVLRGTKSPLHDRYIVVDNKAYLLGSSLNELGSRATTLIKVPTPEILIEQATHWWDKDASCVPLETYVNQLNAGQ